MLAFKTIGRGFASRQRIVFFTRRRRRRLSIYQSYYGREETKYNRSEWCSGRALAFKATGRGFAPRNCFVFFARRRRRRVSMRTSEDQSGPLVTCTGNPCLSTGTSSPVSTGDLPGLSMQVTNGPDRSSEVLIYESYYGREVYV